MRFFIAALLLLSILILTAEEQEKGAEVVWKKESGKIIYKIILKDDFKKNNQAPFKFELKKGDNLIKKVEWSDFSGKDNQFTYSSEMKEDNFNYWFIVCKYKDGKQINCQTIASKKIEIQE